MLCTFEMQPSKCLLPWLLALCKGKQVCDLGRVFLLAERCCTATCSETLFSPFMRNEWTGKAGRAVQQPGSDSGPEGISSGHRGSASRPQGQLSQGAQTNRLSAALFAGTALGG